MAVTRLGATPFQADNIRMVREIGIFYISVPLFGLAVGPRSCKAVKFFHTAYLQSCIVNPVLTHSIATSLLISPYQNHEAIAAAAREMGEQYGVDFLYRDFRPLFQEGQQFARIQAHFAPKIPGARGR